MKPPFSYYGGKQTLAPIILSLIPEHNTYVEPFCGGAAIFFAKKPSEIEILNDTNRELVNFYYIVKNKFSALEKEIRTTLHSRDQHRRALVVYENPDMFDEVKRAWSIFVLATQGYAGNIGSSWGYDKTGICTRAKTIKNKREAFVKAFAERLEKTQFESIDAIRIIETRDHEDTFFYVDPPYYNANMGHYDGYTLEDFRNLLTCLQNIKGKFMLSSYPSEIITQYTQQNHWFQIQIEQRVAASRKGKRKTEVISANYPIQMPENTI